MLATLFVPIFGLSCALCSFGDSFASHNFFRLLMLPVLLRLLSPSSPPAPLLPVDRLSPLPPPTLSTLSELPSRLSRFRSSLSSILISVFFSSITLLLSIGATPVTIVDGALVFFSFSVFSSLFSISKLLPPIAAEDDTTPPVFVAQPLRITPTPPIVSLPVPFLTDRWFSFSDDEDEAELSSLTNCEAGSEELPYEPAGVAFDPVPLLAEESPCCKHFGTFEEECVAFAMDRFASGLPPSLDPPRAGGMGIGRDEDTGSHVDPACIMASAGLPSELHESVEGSRLRKLTPNRELASSTLGSVLRTSAPTIGCWPMPQSCPALGGNGSRRPDCDDCGKRLLPRVSSPRLPIIGARLNEELCWGVF
uniref:Uncharacterized protein n=1 Tax=Anopheles atroparvus TaxID=41427 RepID=A0A182J2X0_ANOAO